jgi:hypothetical protein
MTHALVLFDVQFWKKMENTTYICAVIRIQKVVCWAQNSLCNLGTTIE